VRGCSGGGAVEGIVGEGGGGVVGLDVLSEAQELVPGEIFAQGGVGVGRDGGGDVDGRVGSDFDLRGAARDLGGGAGLIVLRVDGDGAGDGACDVAAGVVSCAELAVMAVAAPVLGVVVQVDGGGETVAAIDLDEGNAEVEIAGAGVDVFPAGARGCGGGPYSSEIFGAEAGLFSDLGQRCWSDFLSIVETESEIAPARPVQFAMRAYLFPKRPSDTQQRGVDAPCLCRAPHAHAANNTLRGSGTSSPLSIMSARICKAIALTFRTASSSVDP